MFFLKKALLAKTEGAYGVDSVPTGVANAILAKNVSITPLDAEQADRDFVLTYFGNFGSIPGSAQVKVEFETEIAGAGAPGTAPAWGPLIRSCAFAETINAGVDVLYALISGGFESCTIYFNLDGVLHRLTGCRGKVSLEFNHEALPILKFAMTGIYNAPTDTPLPAPVFTAWQRPLPMNKVNTTPFLLHAYPAILSKLSIDTGSQVEFNAYVNSTEDVRITGRPKVTGNATIEATSVAAKNWWAISRSAATGPFALTHGVVAGNIVTIDAPAVQLGNPSYEDASGIAMLGLPLIFQSVSGNDELSIRVQ